MLKLSLVIRFLVGARENFTDRRQGRHDWWRLGQVPLSAELVHPRRLAVILLRSLHVVVLVTIHGHLVNFQCAVVGISEGLMVARAYSLDGLCAKFGR